MGSHPSSSGRRFQNRDMHQGLEVRSMKLGLYHFLHLCQRAANQHCSQHLPHGLASLPLPLAPLQFLQKSHLPFLPLSPPTKPPEFSCENQNCLFLSSSFNFSKMSLYHLCSFGVSSTSAPFSILNPQLPPFLKVPNTMHKGKPCGHQKRTWKEIPIY